MPLRKRILERPPAQGRAAAPWLPLEELAEVELTSEDPAYPIDAALSSDATAGWRASAPGEQVIRLTFEHPQPVRLIHLVFEDTDQERVQEFTVRWSADRGAAYETLLRQQFAFSPSGATRETEDYAVDLTLTDLELRIVPDISHRPVVASLRELRLK